MSLSREHWSAFRAQVSAFLAADSPAYRTDPRIGDRILVPLADAEMLLPAQVGDYSDFYASLYHASNVGSMFRPDNPLLPNYKWVPIGYHGRASSIVVSGTPVRRPRGQIKGPGDEPPVFAPSRALDYEMEVGCYVGSGNPLGHPVELDRAGEHLFGMSLVNDWSARDIQTWEYQPLGPFLSKSFATTV
jgi:fumarylacetoacetase